MGIQATTKTSRILYSSLLIAVGLLTYQNCSPSLPASSALNSATGASTTGSMATTVIYRFYNATNGHFLTQNYNSALSSGFTYDNIKYAVYLQNYDGSLRPLYSCIINGSANHFVSNDTTCNGQTVEEFLGYTLSTADANSVQLYLFSKSNNDYLPTTTYSEGVNNGYTYQTSLGYVLPQ